MCPSTFPKNLGGPLTLGGIFQKPGWNFPQPKVEFSASSPSPNSGDIKEPLVKTHFFNNSFQIQTLAICNIINLHILCQQGNLCTLLYIIIFLEYFSIQDSNRKLIIIQILFPRNINSCKTRKIQFYEFKVIPNTVFVVVVGCATLIQDFFYATYIIRPPDLW